jgi:hypothetical protein
MIFGGLFIYWQTGSSLVLAGFEVLWVVVL